jgi:hypothetical protein
MRYLMEPELARDLGVPGASTIERSIASPAELLEALPHLAGILDGRALEALLKGFYDAPSRHGTRQPFAIHPSMRFTPHPLHKLNPLVPRA